MPVYYKPDFYRLPVKGWSWPEAVVKLLFILEAPKRPLRNQLWKFVPSQKIKGDKRGQSPLDILDCAKGRILAES